jgi:hypothetical protein
MARLSRKLVGERPFFLSEPPCGGADVEKRLRLEPFRDPRPRADPETALEGVDGELIIPLGEVHQADVVLRLGDGVLVPYRFTNLETAVEGVERPRVRALGPVDVSERIEILGNTLAVSELLAGSEGSLQAFDGPRIVAPVEVDQTDVSEHHARPSAIAELFENGVGLLVARGGFLDVAHRFAQVSQVVQHATHPDAISGCRPELSGDAHGLERLRIRSAIEVNARDGAPGLRQTVLVFPSLVKTNALLRRRHRAGELGRAEKAVRLAVERPAELALRSGPSRGFFRNLERETRAAVLVMETRVVPDVEKRPRKLGRGGPGPGELGSPFRFGHREQSSREPFGLGLAGRAGSEQEQESCPHAPHREKPSLPSATGGPASAG